MGLIGPISNCKSPIEAKKETRRHLLNALSLTTSYPRWSLRGRTDAARSPWRVRTNARRPRRRRELVPARRTPDETNEKQTMIPSGICLFIVWRSSDKRAPDASQTKASFVSPVTRRLWHVREPNLERSGQALVSGVACTARRHTESLQEPASGQGLAADSEVITLFPTAHLLADFASFRGRMVGTVTPEGRSPRATVLIRCWQRCATIKYAVTAETALPVASQGALW